MRPFSWPLVRFAAAGAASLGVILALTALFERLGFQTSIAYAGALALSFAANVTVSRMLVFGAREEAVGAQAVRHLVVTATARPLEWATFDALHGIWVLDAAMLIAAVQIASALVKFQLCRHWVYAARQG